jgi:hypothetical protein
MKVVTSVSILISFQRKVKYTGWLMASIFIAVFGNSFLYALCYCRSDGLIREGLLPDQSIIIQKRSVWIVLVTKTK